MSITTIISTSNKKEPDQKTQSSSPLSYRAIKLLVDTTINPIVKLNYIRRVFKISLTSSSFAINDTHLYINLLFILSPLRSLILYNILNANQNLSSKELEFVKKEKFVSRYF